MPKTNNDNPMKPDLEEKIDHTRKPSVSTALLPKKKKKKKSEVATTRAASQSEKAQVPKRKEERYDNDSKKKKKSEVATTGAASQSEKTPVPKREEERYDYDTDVIQEMMQGDLEDTPKDDGTEGASPNGACNEEQRSLSSNVLAVMFACTQLTHFSVICIAL